MSWPQSFCWVAATNRCSSHLFIYGSNLTPLINWLTATNRCRSHLLIYGSNLTPLTNWLTAINRCRSHLLIYLFFLTSLIEWVAGRSHLSWSYLFDLTKCLRVDMTLACTNNVIGFKYVISNIRHRSSHDQNSCTEINSWLYEHT